MKSILEQLQTSEDAVEFGRNASKKDIELLKSLRNVCGGIVKNLTIASRENERDYKRLLNEALKMGIKAQFCSEALQEANKL